MILMSFWGKIGGFFKDVGRTLANAVVAFVKSDAAKAILQSAEGQIVNTVVNMISGASYASLTNPEKRDLAFNTAKAEIVKNGLEVRDHMIDLAIATAVAALKNLGPK